MTTGREGEYIMSVDTLTNVEWLQSLQRFGIKPGLQRTKQVLTALGNPELNLRFLHVAGTNGKGSVCAFLTSLLSVHHRVGTFTSPAFSGYRGRFVVAGEEISEEEFSTLIDKVRHVCEKVVPDNPLTEFEVLTVMAILYFYDQQAEVVVWETGLGGRYDSTNVVLPLVTAITNVGWDHMDVLGHTIREIAYDKAGIIKPDVPIVTAAQGEALSVIRNIAGTQEAPLLVKGIHFTETVLPKGQQRIHYRGLHRDVWDISVGLYGRHQLENAAVALAIYELACQRGPFTALADDEIRSTLLSARWPCRFEIFRVKERTVILDGAHNVDGVRRFVESLQQFATEHKLPANQWTFVIGMLNDKDVSAMLKIGLPFASKVFVTAPAVARARSAEVLAKNVKECRPDIQIEVVSPVSDAVHAAAAESPMVCCFGSLYTVHEARKAMVQTEEYMK